MPFYDMNLDNIEYNLFRPAFWVCFIFSCKRHIKPSIYPDGNEFLYGVAFVVSPKQYQQGFFLKWKRYHFNENKFSTK